METRLRNVKSSCCFDLLFLFFFKAGSGSIPAASRRVLVWWTYQVRFLKYGFGWSEWKLLIEVRWFAIFLFFEKSENQPVLLTPTVNQLFFKDSSGSIPGASREKRDLFRSMDFSGSIPEWCLVDQMIVDVQSAGLRFSSFEKSENQLIFWVHLFFYLIIHSFSRTLQVRFLVRSEKATFGSFDGRLSFDSWKMGLVDYMIVVKTNCWFVFFFIREKRKPAVLSNSTIYSINLFFQGPFRFDSWRVQKKRHLNLFQNDVSGSILERWVWFIRW